MRPIELAKGLLEDHLGLNPGAAPDEHPGIVRPAHREHGPVRPALAELLQLLAPLRCALSIARLLAGIDQAAAGRACRVDVAHLASHCRDGGLVQTAHPGDDLAEIDESQSLIGQREHLDVGVAERPAQRLCLGGEGTGGGWIVLDQQADVRLGDQQPPALATALAPQ